MYLTATLQIGKSPKLPEAGWQLIVRTAGASPDSPRPDPWPSQEHLPVFLSRYGVRYVITSPTFGRNAKEAGLRAKSRDDGLARLGFHEAYAGEKYALWERAEPASETQSR
jgi:hypothetical protein